VLQKLWNIVNVAFLILIVAFIGANLYRLGIFFLQGTPAN
jgi:hypothetical protein